MLVTTNWVGKQLHTCHRLETLSCNQEAHPSTIRRTVPPKYNPPAELVERKGNRPYLIL